MTQPPSVSEDEARRRRARQRQIMRIAGLLLGLILVGAALVFVWRHTDQVADALAALRRPSITSLGLLALAIIGNIVLTAGVFSVLMSKHGRVGVLEMQALVAASALLNYLPLRPGLFGRVAYHKLVNRIPVRATAQVIVQSIALSVLVGAFAAGAISLARSFGAGVAWFYAPLPVLALAGMLTPRLRYLSAALLLRAIDVIVWAARYVLVFQLLDWSINLDTALALAVISMFATMVPFISNGLGLREWAVGLAAPLLEVAVDSPLAITADLVNRAAEIAVVAVCGLLGLIILAPRRRVAGSEVAD